MTDREIRRLVRRHRAGLMEPNELNQKLTGISPERFEEVVSRMDFWFLVRMITITILGLGLLVYFCLKIAQ